jgi:hypothetical protein
VLRPFRKSAADLGLSGSSGRSAVLLQRLRLVALPKVSQEAAVHAWQVANSLGSSSGLLLEPTWSA